jgi:hypothetical protein
MSETFLVLFTAHLLADFAFQPDALVRRKRQPFFFLLHVALVGLSAALLLGAAAIPLLALLMAGHAATDAVKMTFFKDNLVGFSIDQGVHLAMLGALAWFYPEAAAQGWIGHADPSVTRAYLRGLCLVSGTLASVQFGAVLIRKAVAGFTQEIARDLERAAGAGADASNIEGLKNGGYYIGCLERALVFLLILIAQPTGVGFLITAKSILRFGDIKESIHQKRTEYVIIGSFMSFGWAILIATLTQAGMSHWSAK